MDWSLVLTSQEIENTISNEEGWGLLVDEADFERAISTLKTYQRENRGWKWRQTLPGTALVFHWASLVPCALFVAFFVLGESRIPALKPLGMMNSNAVSAGEWWRLFSAIFLHADTAHLAANLATGFILFGIAMARYGAGVGLLASFLAGAGGNLAGFVIYPNAYLGLGASGMIMGALGLLAVDGILAWRTTGTTYLLRRGAGAAILVLALIGFSEKSDVLAHVGGFFFGAVFGTILHFAPKVFRGKSANAISVFISTALTILVWWFALRKH
jgi:membrane associated rhomboid family serine protease